MIKTIEPFIELNWHTVPLKGKLERLANGKKTTPFFEDNWLAKYTKDRNTQVTDIGGAITGKVSDIIAIDCDNTITFEIIKKLDPTNRFIFMSKEKRDGLGNLLVAGTFVYKYVEELCDSYKLHDNTMSFDFLSNNRFMYLPTEANRTKEAFDLDDAHLAEPPPQIIALLKSLKPVQITKDDKALEHKTWRSHLAPQADRFTKTKKVTAEFFRVITPYDFRNLDSYIEKGFLHPDDVPDGRGSEYMSKISAILGADESIDDDLYINTMMTINECFSTPLPKVRLSSTIIEPMVEERASIDGVPIWKYNENWQDDTLSIVTKRNNLIDAFFDPDRLQYYIADSVSESVKRFSRDAEFFSYIETVAVEPPNKKETKQRLPLVNVVSSPAYYFGFFTDKGNEQAFNTFSPTPALRIFKDPKLHASKYSRPDTILNYLESLIPDNYMRNYLLKFLRRKLDKFEYSPTIIYLLGVSGAGKDTLVAVIQQLIGSDAVARPTVREFLEMYNGWILDKYFIQLDEYGNQLSRFDEKESALGKIKAYTGKQEVQIRAMRTDGFNYTHSATFIMTANQNPLFLDNDDRRVALFNCPNKLANELWVQEAGGISEVIERIDREILDFAYYLATEIDSLSKDDYMQPPETADKKLLIASKFSAGQKIAFLLGAKMFVEVEKLGREFDVPKIFDGAPEGRMYEEELFDLYYEMTDGKGTKRGLTSAMKEFDKVPTTRDGQKSYYYNIPSLRGFKPHLFTPLDIEDTVIGGVD